MIYPCDAKTITWQINPKSSIVILNATSTNRTILNLALKNHRDVIIEQVAKNSNGDIIAYVFGRQDTDDRQFTYRTSQAITIYNNSKTEVGFGHIVYVDRDISLTQAVCEATTTPTISGGFTHGEIVISLLLFLILIGGFLAFILINFLGFKIKRGAKKT